MTKTKSMKKTKCKARQSQRQAPSARLSRRSSMMHTGIQTYQDKTTGKKIQTHNGQIFLIMPISAKTSSQAPSYASIGLLKLQLTYLIAHRGEV